MGNLSNWFLEIFSPDKTEFTELVERHGVTNAKVGDVYGLEVVEHSDTALRFALVKLKQHGNIKQVRGRRKAGRGK